MDFKLEIAQAINNTEDFIGLITLDEAKASIEIPANSQNGDYAFPCFRLSKALKKAPNQIAVQLSDKIQKPLFIEKIETAGGYINFYLNRREYAKSVFNNVFENGDSFFKDTVGSGKNIVIDYSSPNIAKPFHVGHLRSTVIGNALKNIFTAQGYKVFSINHLGDWGTQFGKLIVAYKKWGNKEEVEKEGISELNRLYVKFHEEAEVDKALLAEGRLWLLKMQQGDNEALSLWKWFNDISLLEFNRIYDRLNIKFDYFTGESFFNDKMDAVVEELKEKGLLVESEGAMVVDLSQFNMPPCLILRSDGGTLYPTRDIAAALYRHREYSFHKCIIVTALDQNLHFAQWFKVLELMGYDFAKDLVHVPFGLVSLNTGKLSTRKGNVVLMEELLNEAAKKTMDIIEEKNPALANKEATAEAVGIGAIIFNDLYNSRIKDVVFSWEKMLSFDGETGPYVQYTNTRANSILAKAEQEGLNLQWDKVDFGLLSDDTSFEVVKLVYGFKDKIGEAAAKLEPFIISRHLMALSQAFNKFYNENSVLGCEDSLKQARLALVKCTALTLREGLKLLGIDAPEKM